MQDKDRWGWEHLLGIEREEFPPYAKSLSNRKKENERHCPAMEQQHSFEKLNAQCGT